MPAYTSQALGEVYSDARKKKVTTTQKTLKANQRFTLKLSALGSVAKTSYPDANSCEIEKAAKGRSGFIVPRAIPRRDTYLIGDDAQREGSYTLAYDIIISTVSLFWSHTSLLKGENEPKPLPYAISLSGPIGADGEQVQSSTDGTKT